MQIKKGIYFRYEPEIKEGTAYIFDIHEENVYKTSKFVYDILNRLQEGVLLEQLIFQMEIEYGEFEKAKINNSVNDVIESLLSIGILINE